MAPSWIVSGACEVVLVPGSVLASAEVHTFKLESREACRRGPRSISGLLHVLTTTPIFSRRGNKFDLHTSSVDSVRMN